MGCPLSPSNARHPSFACPKPSVLNELSVAAPLGEVGPVITGFIRSESVDVGAVVDVDVDVVGVWLQRRM